jgi:hypothetical protein
MLRVQGVLKTPDGSPIPGYRVVLRFHELVPIEGSEGSSVEPLAVPAVRETAAEADGRFELMLPDAGQLAPPLSLTVVAPTGAQLVRRALSVEELRLPLSIPVSPVEKFAFEPSDDPALGRTVRLVGRVIDERGAVVPAGLPVVVWGVPPGGGAEAPAEPLVTAATQVGGYFAGDWTARELRRAFGTVQGGRPVPVPLMVDGRLPTRVILVIQAAEVAAGSSGECACDAVPPRTPDPADLTANPEAFSQDLGGGCMDLTVPNRVLEEFTYSFVVRTSEPAIQGLTLGRPRPLPRPIRDEIFHVARPLEEHLADRFAMRTTSTPAATRESALDAGTAAAVLKNPIALNPAAIRKAVHTTQVGKLLEAAGVIMAQRPERTALDAAHPVDWDDTPTIYQATTVSHGHVLQYRQVWRADGYSLGDLLHSLPLAPGQKRQIAVLDWERRTSSARTESLEEEEQLDAFLSRDRDVSEIVGSQFQEEIAGGSRSSSWGVAGGIGAGFIGSGFGIFGGVAGGAGGSSASSWQNSCRDLSASSLQQLRDRTSQRASAVRDQRSTVIQTVAQGETVRATTEVVANYNHCHAITVEYFEVLRHFLVTHELTDVRECLFVPLPMGPFDRAKAQRWREPLQRFLRRRELRGAFAALDRVQRNWDGYDLPARRYSEEAPDVLEGELRISFLLPRPRDAEDGKFQVDMWNWLIPLLDTTPFALWTARLAAREQAERDRYFLLEVAPGIAERLVQQLQFAYVTRGGLEVPISLDATLVSRYAESVPLYVSLRPAGSLTPLPREEIARFKVWYDGGDLPPDARVIVHSGRVRYRTPHLSHLLFDEPRILNDLGRDDAVVVATPLARQELRDPRTEDIQLADRLVKHLNDHLEYYHQAIWASMDSNRRYMLLDGAIAPNSGGRSIASVVENRLIGIVGNCLVMPVAPGHRLDKSFADDRRTRGELIHLYATDPAPPIRVSVPTRGVYAEAVMGSCNACEKKDDTRFWRWEESPIPDSPTAIEPLSLDSRATPEPDLKPTPLPPPIVAIQNAPELPDPLGLQQAFQILGRADAFRDVTGLAATQKNALAAFQGALDTAKFFGGEAAKLAQQQALSQTADRTLAQIQNAEQQGLLSHEQAQSLTESALRGLVGETRPAEQGPAADPAIERAIDAAAQSEQGSVSVRTPSESLDARFEGGAGSVGQAPPAASVDNQLIWLSLPWIKDEHDPVSNQYRRLPAPSRSVSELEALEWENPDPANRFILRLGLAYLTHRMRRDPADATKFQIPMRLRIVHPADPATPSKIAGAGKLPVAVLVHGNHEAWNPDVNPVPTTTRGGVPVHDSTRVDEVLNHEGYSYLQEELAKQGIVSVSVDNNFANATGSLVEMRAEMILAALDELRRLNGAKGSRYKGRLDLDNVGLMGHSRGGDAVVLAAKLNLNRSPASRFGIRTVCSLAPTDVTGSLPPGSRMFLDFTDLKQYAVVYGTHDGDVSGIDGALGSFGTGFRHYDRARCPKALVFLDGCTHNRFNRTWSTDEDGVIPDPALQSRADHEKLAVDYVAGLFRWQLKGETTPRDLFDGTGANSVGSRTTIQWAFGTQFKLVEDFENPANNLIGGTRSLPLAPTVRIDPIDLLTIGGSPLARKSPHQTIVLVADLTAPPATSLALTTTVPAAHADWSGFKLLTFSLAANFDVTSAATINGGPLPKAVLIVKDTAGVTAKVDGSGFQNQPTRPIFHQIRIETAPGVFTNVNVSMIRMETIRVPLSAFAGIDLTKVAELSVEIDPANGTHVFLDAIKLVTL